MKSLGPGCALEGILFACVEDQIHVVEVPGQAQHPVIKAFTLILHSRSTEPVHLCTDQMAVLIEWQILTM